MLKWFEWSVAIAGAAVLVYAAYRLKQLLGDAEVKRGPEAKSDFEIAMRQSVVTANRCAPGFGSQSPWMYLADYVVILERRVIELEEKAAKRWWHIR